MTSTSTTMAAIALAALLLSCGSAEAQQRSKKTGQGQAKPKKLYCWNEAGQRICSDALPQEAVNAARDEFSVASGLRSGGMDRTLDADERVALAQQEAQRRFEVAAEQTRQRTEQAMLITYKSEDDLRRVFGERTGILNNNIQGASYNVASLRESLVILLEDAGTRELAGQPVKPDLAAQIRQRHNDLQAQRRMQSYFEQQRQDLEVEIENTLQRYRELKAITSSPRG